MPKTKAEQCNCSWAQCSWISEQIEARAPKGHVWRGRCHRWNESKLKDGKVFEGMLFLATMCQHVPGIKDVFQDGGKRGHRKEIVLARHHFPIAVYKYLKSRKITSFLKFSELKALIKRYLNTRYDQAGKLASLVATIVPPGKLLKLYTSHEKECLAAAAKANLVLCAPTATEQCVVDTVNALRSRKEESVPPVAAVSRLDQLLPGATYTIREMQALLNMSKTQKEEQSNETKDEKESQDEGQDDQIKESHDKEHDKESHGTEQSNATQDEEQTNEAQDKEQLNEPQGKGQANESQDDVSVQSSAFIPPIEHCVAKIQSKVQTLGIEHAKDVPNFCDALSVLRRLHMNFSPIQLSQDGNNPSYLFPCKDTDLANNRCETYRIASKWRREGMYCLTCKKTITQNLHNERKRGKSSSLSALANDDDATSNKRRRSTQDRVP